VTKTMQAGNPARTVQVRVDLPLEFFKQLSKAADQRELKVGVLVAGLAQIGASKSAPDSCVEVCPGFAGAGCVYVADWSRHVAVEGA